MYRDREQRDFARDLRNQPTEAEKRLWRLLRAEQLKGFKFRRQAAIGPYIVDFVCFSHKLIVELDGPHHAEETSIKHDSRRTAWLSSQGFPVIRFWNYQLDEEIHAVVDAIMAALGATVGSGDSCGSFGANTLQQDRSRFVVGVLRNQLAGKCGFQDRLA